MCSCPFPLPSSSSPRRGLAVRRRLFAASLLVASLVVGCASNPGMASGAHAAADLEPLPPTADGPTSEEALRRLLDQAQRENARLRRRLREKTAALASIEERYAALEIELASVVEEVLRSKASLRSVQSRALAISRIAEVRVELRAVEQPEDPEVAVRLERAIHFLDRADEALAEENYGGAVFLAERANDVVRQAKIVGEIRASSDAAHHVIPIVPPRPTHVLMNANLRKEPSIEARRLGGLEQGSTVTALARAGDWLQIETESGKRAWIHRSLVR